MNGASAARVIHGTNGIALRPDRHGGSDRHRDRQFAAHRTRALVDASRRRHVDSSRGRSPTRTCRSPAIRLFVGSKPTHPRSGSSASTQAWVAPTGERS